MVRHVVVLIIAESSQQRLECYTNKAPDMHWDSWTVSRSSIPAEPEEAWSVTSRAAPGSHAAWDRSSLTVERLSQQRSPESLPMHNRLHVAVKSASNKGRV